MSDRLLSHGDTGPDVQLAQQLLDRDGALLDVDGQFGPGTATAVGALQAEGALPVTGQIDDATWLLLRLLPDPCPDVAIEAVTFIAHKEVSSRAYYDAVECQPSYPGGDSGMTIGVGYDLRFQSSFVDDWSPVLPPAAIAALQPYVGRPGSNAAAAALALLRVPWAAAWTVYCQNTLPDFVGKARAAFAGFDDLAPLCRGVLVSLVYNRGTGMADAAPGDRKEMRAIRDAVAEGRPGDVPDLLRSMKRLWPNMRGLRDRRDQEASLFEQGLSQA